MNKYKILRVPDTDPVGSVAQEVDPLTAAAGGQSTDFPVLSPDRLLEFTVKSAKNEKNEKGVSMTTLKVAVNKDTTFTDGKPCRAGFSFNQTLLMSPTGGYDIEMVKTRAALWIKALVGPQQANSVPMSELRDNPSRFEGLVFTARTGINKDKNGAYPDSTRLTPVIPDGN